MRPQRERHHQAQLCKGEEVRAAQRLGGFGALAAGGRSPRFTDRGYDLAAIMRARG
jgi:hypothetical protein